MAWWGEQKGHQELVVGDQPLDALNSAMKKVARDYTKDIDRKPTREEWEYLLETSIKVLQEELFDDIDELEVASVVVQLKRRPKRPKLNPGDYFAIPLASGGYGYGRVMKIKHRILLWMRLIDTRSKKLLSAGDVHGKRTLLDVETDINKIMSVEWPIIGHVPLSEEERTALSSEPKWATGYVPLSVEEIADWKLSGKRGFPPGSGLPYVGYRDE